MTESERLSHDWFPKPLPDNVEIGAGSWLYSAFAFLHYRSLRPCGVRIGHDTGIYNGTFFDLGACGEVVIGDHCTLVGAIIATNRRVSIADYVFIAHEVTIADDFVACPPTDSGQANRLAAETCVSIGRGAWIGARAVLLSGAHIGPGAIVGAGCVVSTDVPACSVVAGNPARIIEKPPVKT
ncbi:MAG TPA: acyltransferase [Pirellulales bacterium]|jgi:acetyltransferase-like isoleucine patch superfamily enzyme|nr:acyltransferase [Pirellulales bacterium]